MKEVHLLNSKYSVLVPEVPILVRFRELHKFNSEKKKLLIAILTVSGTFQIPTEDYMYRLRSVFQTSPPKTLRARLINPAARFLQFIHHHKTPL